MASLFVYETKRDWPGVFRPRRAEVGTVSGTRALPGDVEIVLVQKAAKRYGGAEV